MILLASYISSLEGDKVKLKAQVKRLCAENNWLRESLQESQQLLQEAEVSLTRLTTEKEHLEFVQSQHHQRGTRDNGDPLPTSSPAQSEDIDTNSYNELEVDTQCEEKKREGKCVRGRVSRSCFSFNSQFS